LRRNEPIRRLRAIPVVSNPNLVAELFDTHAAELYRYLARRAGHTVAEEVLSQTFLVAVEQQHRYDPNRASARAWLYGIAVNLLRHHYRSETRKWQAYARYPLELVDDTADVATSRADATAAQRSLARPIAELHEADRDVLLLYAWADLSYAEIAAALHIPVGTVRSRLHRVRTQLRVALSDDSVQETVS
jgi:RNA polymerase sigma-70 factor, ECF subfamily